MGRSNDVPAVKNPGGFRSTFSPHEGTALGDELYVWVLMQHLNSMHAGRSGRIPPEGPTHDSHCQHSDADNQKVTLHCALRVLSHGGCQLPMVELRQCNWTRLDEAARLRASEGVLPSKGHSQKNGA
jgi:hypothetical protein